MRCWNTHVFVTREAFHAVDPIIKAHRQSSSLVAHLVIGKLRVKYWVSNARVGFEIVMDVLDHPCDSAPTDSEVVNVHIGVNTGAAVAVKMLSSLHKNIDLFLASHDFVGPILQIDNSFHTYPIDGRIANLYKLRNETTRSN